MLNSLAQIFKRKKKPFKEYEFEQLELNLKDEGLVQYAQWMHPGESQARFTQTHVDLFKHYIKRGDFVIDIGAQQGDTTVAMALAAGAEGTTLGLEPNPHSFKILEANSKLNKEKTNIIPLNFAASTEDGEFTFGSGDPSYGNGGLVGFTHNEKRNVRYTFQVTGKNLHKYLVANYNQLLPKLTFIKIDTEGYDKEIIKAMPEIINQYRPYMAIECFGPSLKEEKLELFDLLTAKKYSLYKIDDFNLSTKMKIERSKAAIKDTYNILAIPIEKE
ncbi:MAG: FkbM family methyltransferase [Cyclobacteriaceae bacterium]